MMTFTGWRPSPAISDLLVWESSRTHKSKTSPLWSSGFFKILTFWVGIFLQKQIMILFNPCTHLKETSFKDRWVKKALKPKVKWAQSPMLCRTAILPLQSLNLHRTVLLKNKTKRNKTRQPTSVLRLLLKHGHLLSSASQTAFLFKKKEKSGKLN